MESGEGYTEYVVQRLPNWAVGFCHGAGLSQPFLFRTWNGNLSVQCNTPLSDMCLFGLDIRF